MLLRLAYLTATNTLSLIRLLPMSERDKDVERYKSLIERLGLRK